MIYTTNCPSIVEHAKYCMEHYPTIVNNIPKEKNHYDSSMLSFARVDNKIGNSQMAIGTSSNLAQMCLSYSYSFPEKKYNDYVCILSVLAQVAIDNAKRSFEIDLNEEIDRIKKDMDISINGYPIFWKPIKKKNDKRNGVKISQLSDKQIARRNSKYNEKLICPMNYLYLTNISGRMKTTHTYDMSKFFNKYELDISKKRSKKVEDLIEKYSLRVLSYNVSNYIDNNENYEDYILLRSDFNQMIEDIRQTPITKNYLGLMSYLIDRAFMITPEMRENKDKVRLSKNRSLLLKTLYEVNPQQLLKCFSKNVPLKA